MTGQGSKRPLQGFQLEVDQTSKRLREPESMSPWMLALSLGLNSNALAFNTLLNQRPRLPEQINRLFDRSPRLPVITRPPGQPLPLPPCPPVVQCEVSIQPDQEIELTPLPLIALQNDVALDFPLPEPILQKKRGKRAGERQPRERQGAKARKNKDNEPNLLEPIELIVEEPFHINNVRAQRLEQVRSYITHNPGDWHGAAKLCLEKLFRHVRDREMAAIRELERVLRSTNGAIIPLPVDPICPMPMLVCHEYSKSSKNAKRFYYLLWHLDKPKEHRGRMSPVQCLNGPYRGQHWNRIDEAMRCNEIWAYVTSEPSSRANSLTLGVDPKRHVHALTREARWQQLCRFDGLKQLSSSVFDLRDDGYSFRADLHPYPAFWPPNCHGTAEELVQVNWSQEHWDCNAIGPNGPIPCRCAEGAVANCHHPPLPTLTTKLEVKPLLRERGNPRSMILPHPRRLLRQEHWILHQGDTPNETWYDAIAYELRPVYKTK